MLPASARLSAEEVRHIMKTGKMVRTPTLSARYILGNTRKAGVVVSKKTLPGAVDRNRMRRLVYRVLSSVLPPGVQVVMMVQVPHITEQEITSLCLKLS